MENRRYQQKVAAFNLGVAEAVKVSKDQDSPPTSCPLSVLEQSHRLRTS